jgi:single-strand DNA-binding protein
MSRGFSRVVLVGNLGRDPEMRYLPSGQPVVNFTLAVNRRRRGNDGEYHDETDWYNISVFGRNAEVADQYLKKGRQVLVDGQLSIRKYTGNDGVERTAVEVRADNFTMVGSRDDMGGGGDRDYTPAGGAPRDDQAPKKPRSDEDFDDFDDVPF